MEGKVFNLYHNIYILPNLYPQERAANARKFLRRENTKITQPQKAVSLGKIDKRPNLIK
nr:MAG TPA: hypothetical protein [Caudoviricetes sp.]